MKTIIIGLMVFYGFILYPEESKAGIAGVISWFNGECDEEKDENGVLFCSTKDGKIYYVYDGIKFETYPDIKKD